MSMFILAESDMHKKPILLQLSLLSPITQPSWEDILLRRKRSELIGTFVLNALYTLLIDLSLIALAIQAQQYKLLASFLFLLVAAIATFFFVTNLAKLLNFLRGIGYGADTARGHGESVPVTLLAHRKSTKKGRQ
jgi:hypothetical protein